MFNSKLVGRFEYAKLSTVLKDGHYWFKLEIDGDVYLRQTYSHAIKTLLEILIRDCFPYKILWK